MQRRQIRSPEKWRQKSDRKNDSEATRADPNMNFTAISGQLSVCRRDIYCHKKRRRPTQIRETIKKLAVYVKWTQLSETKNETISNTQRACREKQKEKNDSGRNV